MSNQKMLDKFMSQIGLIENVLGKFVDKILYDRKKEKIKRFLYYLYHKKDIFDLFISEIDRESYNKTLNALTTYYDPIEGDSGGTPKR